MDLSGISTSFLNMRVQFPSFVSSLGNLCRGSRTDREEDIKHVWSMVCKIFGVLSLAAFGLSFLWFLLSAVWKIATISACFVIGHDALKYGESIHHRPSVGSIEANRDSINFPWRGLILGSVICSFLPSANVSSESAVRGARG